MWGNIGIGVQTARHQAQNQSNWRTFIRTATSDLKAMIKASTLKVKAWTFKATGPEAKAFMHYGQSRNQDMQYV